MLELKIPYEILAVLMYKKAGVIVISIRSLAAVAAISITEINES